MRTMQRVTFPVNPGKGKHSALIMRSCFSSLLFSSFFFPFFLFFPSQPSCAIPMKATQTLRQPYVLNLSAQTQMTSMTSPTNLFLFFSDHHYNFFFFLVKRHYIISLKYIRQFELAVIHPVTITLVVCIVKRVRTVSQKQIIKLTALTLAKVREELSNTLMLTLLQSLYLNNSPGS